jgi:hypothetical protein
VVAVTRWCVVLADDLVPQRGREIEHDFVAFVAALTEFCPFTEALRWGVVAVPMRGPSRFHGGEESALLALRRLVESFTPARVGIAEGIFAAEAAARRSCIVADNETEDFRRSLPVEELARRELSSTARRLGISSVGQFADLPASKVAERFSSDVVMAHRVARGDLAELPEQRDPRLARRLGQLRGDEEPQEVQASFFGDRANRDERAAAAAHRVGQRLGTAAVCTAQLGEGYSPVDRARFLPWGTTPPAPLRIAPWPGRLPSPAPSLILRHPVSVRVSGARGEPVTVDSRGLLSSEPVWCDLDGRSRHQVLWWAGPWPLVEQWWREGRRRAHAQVAVADLGALLLFAERRSWWVAGIYD